jgi:ornithine cyclodeaminase/alanine dehydrogenase-like protein (mu-crystallin family)
VRAEILRSHHLRHLTAWIERGLLERACGGDVRDGGETQTEYKDGLLLSYAAHVGYLGVMGGKLLAATPANPASGLPYISAVTVLMSSADGATLAVVDGGRLTAVRTACASAVAATLLAHRRDRSVGVIGYGLQATTHLLALSALAMGPCWVWGRSQERAAAFARAMHQRHGIEVHVARDPSDLCKRVGVVVTATSATRPVLNVPDITPGTLLIVVGRYQPGMWEVAPDLARLHGIVVDSRHKFDQSWVGQPSPHTIVELGDLIGTRIDPPQGKVKIFKPMGMGMFDVIAAKYALDHGLIEEGDQTSA